MTYLANYISRIDHLNSASNGAEWHEVGESCFEDATACEQQAWQNYNGHKQVVAVEDGVVAKVARQCDKHLIGKTI